MTVALSILFAALVGGVVFALVDNVGRGERTPADVYVPPTPPPEPVRREPRTPNPPPVPDRLWSGYRGDDRI
jgi:hypothetical protein